MTGEAAAAVFEGHCAVSFSKAAITLAAAVVTSLKLVYRPKENRTAPRATSEDTPIAKSVAEGVLTPAWHAEPVEAATLGVKLSRSMPRT